METQANTQAGPTSPIAAGQKQLNAYGLAPFVDPLPLPARLKATNGKIRLVARERHDKLHRDLPATRQWNYVDPANPSALTPVIEARSGELLEVEWVNELPTKHFFRLTTRCTEVGTMCRKCVRSRTCTARLCRRKMMGIRQTGIRRDTRASIRTR